MHKYQRGRGEVNTLPSLTVPDQTLPLRVLLERYTRGQGVVTLQPHFDSDYDPDFEMPDVSKMDKMDILMMAEENKRHIADIKDEMKKREEYLKKVEKRRQAIQKQEEMEKKLKADSSSDEAV